jgi:hypothetical protein
MQKRRRKEKYGEGINEEENETGQNKELKTG